MAYSEFDVVAAETKLGVQILVGAVFPPLVPVTVPSWLSDTLGRGNQLRVESEKARNEFIVAAILLAVRELSGNALAIFSGESFDVDRSAGLCGEVDFLLTLSQPSPSPSLPIIRAPVICIDEAKRQDIAGGIGQCIAQMVAAQRFNDRNGRPNARVYGCVTTGEDWQFLRLYESIITYDTGRLYRNDIGRILAAFLQVVVENKALAAA